jgi:2-polyprenyl-3-methyl-5-hydroxy-6-metoxy-1,4-benzoquinol methylase
LQSVVAIPVEDTMTPNQDDLVRRHYGKWADSYGDPANDGWFSHVRAREIRIVNQALALRGGESILDAGAGPGIYAVALKQRGHQVWAADFAPEMVAKLEGRVDRALLADVQTLDLGRRFDRILCLGVMEYVADPLTTLRRLADHLAPRGRLIVLVPRQGIGGWFYQREKKKHGLAVRLYSSHTLGHLATQAGLRPVARQLPFFHNLVMVFES